MPPALAGFSAISTIPTRKPQVLLALLVFGYALLLLHNLSSALVWNDEGLSYLVAMDGPVQAMARIAHDVHAPLYYVLLSFVLKLSHGLFALRILSVVAALITVVFVYLSASLLAGSSIGLLAALLFAVAPDNLDWAQHARPYSFQTMLVAISLWGFLHILLARREDDRLFGAGIAQVIRGQRARPPADLWWCAYAFGAGLAMLAQHPGTFYVLACNVVAVVAIIRNPRAARKFLLNWVLANIIAVAIWLTWMPQFLGQLSEHLLGNQIAERHANYLVTDPGQELVKFLGVAYVWRLRALPVVVYLGLVLFGCWRAIREASSMLWVFLLWSIPFVVCVAGYYLVHHAFGHLIFTLHWLAVPYAILVAYGVAALRVRLLAVAALVMLLALNGRGLMNYYQTLPMSRPDLIAQFLKENAKPTDGIIFTPSGSYRYSVAYYLGPDWAGRPGMDPVIDGSHLITTPSAAARQSRNWVLATAHDPPAVSFADLDAYGRLAVDKQFGEAILRRYDRND